MRIWMYMGSFVFPHKHHQGNCWWEEILHHFWDLKELMTTRMFSISTGYPAFLPSTVVLAFPFRQLRIWDSSDQRVVGIWRELHKGQFPYRFQIRYQLCPAKQWEGARNAGDSVHGHEFFHLNCGRSSKFICIYIYMHTQANGCLEHLYFYPLPGEMIQLNNMFVIGWNLRIGRYIHLFIFLIYLFVYFLVFSLHVYNLSTRG